jgi:pilus assembly protein CpaC
MTPLGRILVAVTVVVALAAGPVHGQSANASAPILLDVTLGKSRVVDLKEAFTRVSVTNPNIADVFVVTPNQVLISGKAIGVTSMVIFYPQRSVFFDLSVNTDVGVLQDRLRQIFPRDEIGVISEGEAIILTGAVSTSGVIKAAAEVAATVAPKGKVVNLLSLADVKPQQVMLQVHVAEVARSALRELGFSIRALGGNTIIGALTAGTPFMPPLGLLGPAVPKGTVASQPTPDFAFDNSSFFLSDPGRNYAGLVHALAGRSLLRTLAKPNLVTMSGKEARFLSGGEFPFPVAQQNNAISIEFKEFGVGLIFTPAVVDGETIDLRVRPEVSSLDFSQALVSSGFNIPVVRKNQVYTNISVKDGETFAIAGLINNEVRQAVQKVPLLGDIPILGALFRSPRFQNNETELVFLITVKLVKPAPPASAATPDPTRLMELRQSEKKEFTLVPGIEGVGEVVDRPFGSSGLSGEQTGSSGPSQEQTGFGGPSGAQAGFSGPSQEQTGFGGPSEEQTGFGGPSGAQAGFSGPSQEQTGFGGPSEEQR